MTTTTAGGASTFVADLAAGNERVGRLRKARADRLSPYFREAASRLRPEVVMEGESRLMLGSPNYLGLADHPRVVEAAKKAVDDYGSSLTGSRILNGSTRLHHELEEELADWYGTEGALVYTTGYQTNVGTVSALVGPGDTVVADAYAHASLLDGATLSGAKIRGFRHNRLDLFQESLERAARDGGRTLVLLDGLYSMEGDLNPLDTMVAMSHEFGAGVLVDEAHSVGILGATGTGAAELFGVADRVDVRMGAMSKALASVGGYIVGSQDLLDVLRVNARAFIFSTVGVPPAIGAALEAIRIRRSPEGEELVRALRENSRYLRDGLAQLGFTLGPDSGLWEHTSPIIPVLIRDDVLTMHWWRQLYDRGVFTGVALHPAVPPNGAMLRVCPMATNTREHLDRALDVFAAVSTVLAR